MLFNSIQFLFFFPIVTLCYFLLPHRYRWALLLLASCVFYCAFIPVYILILFFTILIDYVAGIYIEKSEGAKRKRFLIMSIVANVGVLAFFKYFNFFIDNCNALLHVFHLHGDIALWKIILPIGLSFHTFQAMSYTIEVYRGHQKAERHLGIYALYVMFYPQLVAGPIERPQNVLPQFREIHTFRQGMFWSGLRLMLWGFFKKTVIADRLAIYVSAMYANPHSFHQGNVMIGFVLFSFQIYCDFSGYSDIALGAARTMGFTLMKNFDRPYLASDIIIFWRRWHISLSTWFRDYLYISLGGNRVSKWRRNLNLMITFMVSGLWHGANWTFVIWGMLHGLGTIVYSAIRDLMPARSDVSRWQRFGAALLGILFTFSFVTIAWVFFRANTLGQATDLLTYAFGSSHSTWFDYPIINGVRIGPVWYIFVLMLLVLFVLAEEAQAKYEGRFNPGFWLDGLCVGFVFFMICVMGVFNSDSFIYFQF